MCVNKEKEGNGAAAGGGEGRLTGFIPFSPPPLALSPSSLPFLPFLSGLFGFDSGQMVKLCEADREFY